MAAGQIDEPIAEVVNLFGVLNQRKIRYCHWKSNCRLDLSIRGLTDLDLLIDPNDSAQFRSVLDQLEIKPIRSPHIIQYPAIEDYLGYDSISGRLFHLHVHYQLILGEQYVKNYHLPLEEVLLENVVLYQHLVKIPIPELEITVLSIRALLKYRDRDAIKDILSIRSSGIPIGILQEIEYLMQQTDLKKISSSLLGISGVISPDIVLSFLRTVAKSPRAGFIFFNLRERLRVEMRDFQRDSRSKAIFKYWTVVLRKLMPSPLRSSSRKIPVTGGQIFALIGADGAGKSTIISLLHKWLSWKLKTYRFYLGSQQKSAATRSVEFFSRLSDKIWRVWSHLTGEKNIISRMLASVHRFWRNIYFLSIGKDRYNRYTIAKQRAGQGAIVLCDRYPLETVWQTMDERPMDGPRIEANAGGRMDRLTRWLSQRERNIYKKIRPPDQVFVLQVSPEISQARKPDHDPVLINAKSKALMQMEHQGLRIVKIDAEKPIEQVLLQIKSDIWRVI